MWLTLTFISAVLLGLYDVSKKVALRDNAVLPVLLLTTLIASLVFLPWIVISHCSPETFSGSMFYVPRADGWAHVLIVLKSALVLSSWLLGYMGMKHLPITLVGSINATRPIMVLVGAVLLFGERLNLYQWIGVGLGIAALWLLSRTSRKEGISFADNRWILCVFGAAVFGAASGLYDKYLLKQLPPMLVQSWYSVYQVLMMCPLLYLLGRRRPERMRLKWSWAILCIPLLLSVADFAYFFALAQEDAMISVVSMIRRGSVLVSFACGALVFGEHNLRGKAFDLLLILLGMFFLYMGSR